MPHSRFFVLIVLGNFVYIHSLDCYLISIKFEVLGTIKMGDKKMKILGMRAVGEHASSAIQGVGLLMKMDRNIHELAEMVHPHPSIIEGIQECVRMLLNKSIFKASIFKDKLSCYRRIGEYVEDLQRL